MTKPRRAAAALAVAVALLAACSDGGEVASPTTTTKRSTASASTSSSTGGGRPTGSTPAGSVCTLMADVATKLFGPDANAEVFNTGPATGCTWEVNVDGVDARFTLQLIAPGASGLGTESKAVIDFWRATPQAMPDVEDVAIGEAAFRNFNAQAPSAGEQVFVAVGGRLAIVLSPGGGEATGQSLALAALAAAGEAVEVTLVPFKPAATGAPCLMLTPAELGTVVTATGLATKQEADIFCTYSAEGQRTAIAELHRVGRDTQLLDPHRSITDYTTALVDGVYVSRARSAAVFNRVIVRFVASDTFVYELTLNVVRDAFEPTDATDEQLVALTKQI